MSKKVKGLILLLVFYLIAFIGGLCVFKLLENKVPILINILICDVVATIVIWLIGVIFHTASIYDPYWSVQTVLIYVSLMVYYKNYNLGNILFLAFILFWSIRLTYNFISGFNDISYIDWRYRYLQEKTKSFYQIVNLLGICMVPTLIVYAASIPAYLYLINGYNWAYTDIFGLLIMLIATILELVADLNMSQFRKTRSSKDEIINVGIWKYSRHPNYLGEIMFWYGLAFVFIFRNINQWYVIGGAILNTLLFLFISIPLAENHLRGYKKNYDEYVKTTRMLIPIKK